ncbi:cupin domain-containing protein [Flavobacterium sp.]|uniref:cupin domain-containing protein n=1 Tax=Flavobacterium sp. TaxID=239 RepID=UPI0026325D6D|nr:cupin domain-containing protein [Flavobacterium sp.]
MDINKITAVSESEGLQLSIAGGNYRIVISGKQTGGKFAVIEMHVPPGAGPGLHAHTDIHESFFVLEGEVTFQSETGAYTANENAYISIPTGGAVHGFKNTTDYPAKLLCTVMPAGLDDFFIEMDALVQSNLTENDHKEKMKALAEQYGQQFYPEGYFSGSKQ